MNKPVLEIKHLEAGYGNHTILRNINLTVYSNDFLGIIGPNGGGKTTLVKTIVGLLKPFSGEIKFDSSKGKPAIGYMPQINHIDKKFPILAEEVVASGLLSEKDWPKNEKEYRVNQVIYELGLTPFAYKPIGELSGGQLQRVLLARSIVNRPELLILDEPSSYVDPQFELHFYELLQEINDRTAIILVSHDIGTLLSMVKNIACVNETLDYHAGTDVDNQWLEKHFDCPFDIIGHGDIPHRILKKH